MNNNNDDDKIYNLDEEFDVNKKNEDQYNNLIEHSKKSNDVYWDRNNPIVKVVLIGLLVIAVIGTLYYFIVWFKTR